MKQIIWAWMLLLLSQGCMNNEMDNEATDGKPQWKSLFNGKDLTGWEVVGAGKWFVKDSCLQVTRQEGQNGFGWLVSRKDYSNFKLRLKIKMLIEGNSGILIRDPGHAKVYRPAFNGYEVQVFNGEGEKRESLLCNTSGAIYDLSRSYFTELKTQEWNEFEIHCEGEYIATFINGKKMAEIHDRRSFKGAIGLQLHGGLEPAHYCWKDIEILELPETEPAWQLMEEAAEQASGEYVDLLEDRSIDDFEIYWSGNATWTLNDGVLRGENPKEISWIFTNRDYADYILSFDVRVSKGGNAGVCLRFPWEKADGEKGPAFLGYECQVLDDLSCAETNPSGSIYNISRAFPTDLWGNPIFKTGQWNSYKIYVRGNHIVTYVNNRKTADAHVTRDPKGRIGFQLHPPAKWVEYKKMKIKELK